MGSFPACTTFEQQQLHRFITKQKALYKQVTTITTQNRTRGVMTSSLHLFSPRQAKITLVCNHVPVTTQTTFPNLRNRTSNSMWQRETSRSRSAFLFPSHDVLPSHKLPNLTLPGVVATHVKEPDQAVELNIEALDLRIPLTLGGADDGDALAGEVGSPKGSVPAERDGLAVDGIDAVDDDGEGRVRVLRRHEDLLGRESRLAERHEDEGVDAVGSVDEVRGAVLGAHLVRVVGDQLDVDIHDLFGFSLGEAGVCLTGLNVRGNGGECQYRAGKGGAGEN